MGAKALYFAIPGDIATLTGGYIYNRRLMAELRRTGWTIEHLVWPAAFPFPMEADEAAARQSLAACPNGATVLIDGLALGALPGAMAAEADRLRLIALCHHPLALESGLSAETAERLRQSERLALKSVKGVIVTSGATKACLIADYDVDPNLITVAEPGIDMPLELPNCTASTPYLLSVGTVTARKNHEMLVMALARIAELDWHCAIAGSLERSPETVANVRRIIDAAGLRERVSLLGEVDDLSPLYRRADIFVLPSLHEGYGMVLGEALIHGIPIVATRVGPIAEIVPDSAGILVPAGDCEALSHALEQLLDDPVCRACLAKGAYRASLSLHGWDETAARVAAALSP